MKPLYLIFTKILVILYKTLLVLVSNFFHTKQEIPYWLILFLSDTCTYIHKESTIFAKCI